MRQIWATRAVVMVGAILLVASIVFALVQA
jgi:hypothetical protein